MPTLADKVAFLRRPGTYARRPKPVTAIETHMSWIFLADGFVYKLKKDVRFPFLDFSSVARREIACRAELRLNRRLAPTVYRRVLPLTEEEGGRLALGGTGRVVDWLVEMRRLDERLMLDQRIRDGRLTSDDLDRLAALLAGFFRRVPKLRMPPARQLAHWRQRLLENRVVLLRPGLGLVTAEAARIDRLLRAFLAAHGDLFTARVEAGWIVDGHGDLRPEHVWLGQPAAVIDCLEFNPGLRAVDPFDEIAFLGVECARLGAHGLGDALVRRLARLVGDAPPPALIAFYRTYRAMLRARLSIAHLLEPDPRQPEKYRRLAIDYLRLAGKQADALGRLMRQPARRATRVAYSKGRPT